MASMRPGSDAYSVASASNMYEWIMPMAGSACWELVFQMRPAKVSEPTRFSPPSGPSGSLVQKRVLVWKWQRAAGMYRRLSMARILSSGKGVAMTTLRSVEKGSAHTQRSARTWLCRPCASR